MLAAEACSWEHIKKRERFCLPKQQAPNAKLSLCTLILDTEEVKKSTSSYQIQSDKSAYYHVFYQKKPQKNQNQTKNDNYNQLICILCRLGIM